MFRVVVGSTLSFAVLTAIFSGFLLAEQPAKPNGETSGDAAFKPIVEAPLPDGFPTYTPVGEIEVKKYPAHRKAEASGGVAFWTLFQHISSAGIAMTAPVEMTYQADGPPVGREKVMAFLYGDKGIGSPGRKGNVEVVDVPAAMVVSLGMRGARSEAVLVEAEQRLRIWLKQNKTRYEQAGPMRVMGYNSPFVARDRQFFEVQIPIRERSGNAAS